jgi:predicted nucleic acid-binding protein
MSYLEEFDDFKTGGIDQFIVNEKNIEVLILDSSVVFKWFHFKDESSVGIAKTLYEKSNSRFFHILAPELLVYELINIFRFRTKIGQGLLGSVIREVFDIIIFVKLDYKEYIRAFEISQNTGNSVYDCLYVALSDKYRAPLVTADKKLSGSMKSQPHNVILLDDFILEM